VKVLIVSHGHPDQGHGGAQIASYALFRQLRQTAGIDAYYLARVVGRGATAKPIAPIRRHRNEFALVSDSVDAFLIAQQSPAVIAAFARLIREIEPDVVHLHHYIAIGLELIAVVRDLRPQCKIIVTLQEFMAICHHLGQMVKTGTLALCEAANASDCAACFKTLTADDFRVREIFIKSHFAKVDCFIAPSAFLRQRYVDWGLPEHQVVVLDNGVAPVAASPSRPLAPEERRGVFGFFGQIHPFKGLVPLLAAFAALAELPEERTEDIRLLVHGAYLDTNPAPYIEAINDLLARTAGRVTFVGAYEPADLPRLMGAIDWVVVPSVWWENSPLVIQEAFAHRRPVICGDVGGMAEKVRSSLDGFHFAVGSPAALVDLILRIVEDRTVWDRLQKTIAVPLTVEQSALRHIELYRA
jgi:glycosyltransferase involved in cell wall biosynthesis